jgi:REP element-mobilizing transposase RayT
MSSPSFAPIYTAANIRCAFQLNWSLSVFWHDAGPGVGWLPELMQLSESAGMRILQHRLATETCSQFLISTRPPMRPVEIPKGVKGRLQKLVRRDRRNALQRNYHLQSLGSTQRQKIEHYVAGQLQHHADDDELNVDQILADLQIVNPEVDLGRQRFTSHARYRCNLHLVVRLLPQHSSSDPEQWHRIRRAIRVTADRHQHLLSRAGLLSDHVHLVLGINMDQSPLDVVLPYMNNIAWLFDMQSVLRHSCFLGTVGESDLGAISRRTD